MEKTELLFYNDPYMTGFHARVKAVERANGEFEIVLDRTCFYPQGGGQPADTGSIDGIPVTDVKKKDGLVYHRMPSVPEKEEVDGEINWERRFDYMQQHSGQHILSAVLYRVIGYNTVSVHFGEEYASIETDAEHLTDSELVLLEEESNSLICRNIPIRGTWTTSDNLEGYSLRRETKVTGDVRIVALEDFDAVACGGGPLHVVGRSGAG